MINEEIIKSIQKIANHRIKKSHPLMSENHYSEYDVSIIIESFLLLLKEFDNELREDTGESIFKTDVPG